MVDSNRCKAAADAPCAEGRKWVREPKFSDEVKPQEVDRFAQQFGY